MQLIGDWQFLIMQASNVFLLCIIQYFNGLLVIHKNVRVNYTRKINHFLLFFIPIFLNRSYVYDEEYWLYILGAFLAVAKFIFYTFPVRRRISFINTMFRSFDRPEDRPNTLLWITTQTAAGHSVLIPMGILFTSYELYELVLIPLLIYGIGDGLAEPVGVRFGKHKYRAYALFSKRRYIRTLEGSAVVFLTGMLVTAFYFYYFSPLQFAIAMATVPLLMTLAEAFSPHTWDSPFMFLVGFLTLFGITFI